MREARSLTVRVEEAGAARGVGHTPQLRAAELVEEDLNGSLVAIEEHREAFALV